MDPPSLSDVVLHTPEMIRRTHAWFASNSGWSPPDDTTMAEWMSDGVCRCPDDCLVAPVESCSHGLASWWLVLRTLDRPDAEHPLPPVLVAPHPDRLDPRRRDYVAVMDAHHHALVVGEAGYLDPTSGLFVLTACALWTQGACCGRGCRHCPYVDR
jgi:Family of unknown function (DUF5522)